MRWLPEGEAGEIAAGLCEVDRVVDRIAYYRFRSDAAVARWARRALDGRMVRAGATAPWMFGRVWDRVDWPALAAAHSDELVVEDPAVMWPVRSGHRPVAWADLATLFTALSRRTEPVIDVDLGVLGRARSGRVVLQVCPVAFLLPARVSGEDLAAACTMLGRPTARDPDEGHVWMLCDLGRVGAADVLG